MHAFFGGIALIGAIAACVLAILLHEGFHAAASRVLGMALFSFKLSAVGIRAILKGSPKSFKKQAVLYLSGPMGNLLTALLLSGGEGFARNLCEANMAIGCFNLLPMYPLDGGQIFLIVSYKIMGSNRTFKLVKKLSFATKIMLAGSGLVQIFIFGNPSLLVAALMLPGARLLEETVSMMKLENLLNRKQRIMNKGVYSARHIIVMEECTLGEVIQKLDYDRFHIIYVLNGEMEIIGQLTEQQIIKAMQTCSASDKVCDVFFLGI